MVRLFGRYPPFSLRMRSFSPSLAVAGLILVSASLSFAQQYPSRHLTEQDIVSMWVHTGIALDLISEEDAGNYTSISDFADIYGVTLSDGFQFQSGFGAVPSSAVSVNGSGVSDIVFFSPNRVILSRPPSDNPPVPVSSWRSGSFYDFQEIYGQALDAYIQGVSASHGNLPFLALDSLLDGDNVDVSPFSLGYVRLLQVDLPHLDSSEPDALAALLGFSGDAAPSSVSSSYSSSYSPTVEFFSVIVPLFFPLWYVTAEMDGYITPEEYELWTGLPAPSQSQPSTQASISGFPGAQVTQSNSVTVSPRLAPSDSRNLRRFLKKP